MPDMPSKRPLEGVRILEVASIIFGPMAGQYLGDMGAEVIKLEPPEGDRTRVMGPRRNPRMGSFFLTSNRSKRSIVADLKTAEGRQILKALVASSDVLLHSLRTSAADRLGLVYEELAKENPKLIYCHVAGYGDDGLYAGRAAYDDIIQAASGLAQLQTAVAGQPRFIPTIVADKVSAVHAAYAIVVALFQRSQTGVGQKVDVSMFETMAAFNMVEHQWGAAFEPPIAPMGYEPVSSASRRPYRTLDGYLALLPYNDSDWHTFFRLAGAPHFMNDERFATFQARQKNFRLVWDEVERQVARKTNAEWLELLADADIPFSVVNSLDDLMNDPHLESVDFWEIREHASEGALRIPRVPIQMSGARTDITRLPPQLGEHTEEILRECGFDESLIARWTAEGGPCHPQGA
jgi:crotonobetainyl-CoA:carnitine CoA-transferase CaiB-like acyl-CoA transferase